MGGDKLVIIDVTGEIGQHDRQAVAYLGVVTHGDFKNVFDDLPAVTQDVEVVSWDLLRSLTRFPA